METWLSVFFSTYRTFQNQPSPRCTDKKISHDWRRLWQLKKLVVNTKAGNTGYYMYNLYRILYIICDWNVYTIWFVYKYCVWISLLRYRWIVEFNQVEQVVHTWNKIQESKCRYRRNEGTSDYQRVVWRISLERDQ